MHPANRVLKTYQMAQNAAPPLQAVIQLYDGILVRISRAIIANRNNDYERQFNEVMSAVKIVDGLNRNLDMKSGGQVALSIRDFYESIGTGLLRSTGRRYGAEYLEGLSLAVRNMRNAWATIAESHPLH